MFISTKPSINNIKNNSDSVVNFSKKRNIDLNDYSYKNTRVNNERDKDDDFKNVLNSKVDSKTKDIENAHKDTEIEKLDTEENDVEEKDKKELSKEDISEILNSILSLLKNNENTLDATEKTNNNILKLIAEGTNNKASNGDLSDIIKQLTETLQKDSTKNQLNANSLDSIQKLLNQLSEKLNGDNTELGKGVKNGIKDLMSEISKILDNKKSEGDRPLTLEQILQKDLSKQNSESSFSKNNDESSNQSSKNDSELSKENKFLKSLINDDKDDSLNRMNLFAPRIQNTQQGQVVNTNQQVDINKATFTNDLIKDVKYMATNSLKELIVKVNPGNLGEITIKLIQEDGITKANLKANTKETTALLTQNLAEIKKQLVEQNLKIEHVNIELYQEDTTFFKQEGFEKQFEQQGRNGDLNNRTVKSDNLDDVSEENLMENVDAIDNSNVNYLA